MWGVAITVSNMRMADKEMIRLAGHAASYVCEWRGEGLRRSVIGLLHGQGEVCVCDLVDAMQAPQSTVSRHLAQLRQCELVVARRQGTWMHYQLNPALPEWAQTAIATLIVPARAALNVTLPDHACCD